MHERSEGYKPSKPTKIVPKLRGEVWETNLHGNVTVLSRLRGGAVEVMNERGTTEVLFDGQFKKRLSPKVEDGVVRGD